MEIHYDGVDSKWFADLEGGTRANLRRDSGKIKLPELTSIPGRKSTLELLRPYRHSPDGPIVHCGIILNYIVTVDGDEISLSGMSVLRRSTNRGSTGIPTQFEANENLLELKLEDGTPRAVNLAGGGRLWFTPTLLGPAGRPINP